MFETNIRAPRLPSVRLPARVRFCNDVPVASWFREHLKAPRLPPEAAPDEYSVTDVYVVQVSGVPGRHVLYVERMLKAEIQTAAVTFYAIHDRWPGTSDVLELSGVKGPDGTAYRADWHSNPMRS